MQDQKSSIKETVTKTEDRNGRMIGQQDKCDMIAR